MQSKITSTTTLTLKSGGKFVMAAVSLAAALACGPVGAQGSSPGTSRSVYAAGRILVMPHAGMSDGAMEKLVKDNGGGKARRVGKSELRVVDVPPGLEKQMAEKLARHPHFKFAEVDEFVSPAAPSNDPYFGSAWHLQKIGASAAWDLSVGSGVKIAILDTGVDGAHPDLQGRMLPGYNFYDNNTNTTDVHGHGTGVAGTAAATLNNAQGVASVAGQSWILPVRIADANAWATWSTVAQGLNWAADQGARVANISYVGVAGSQSVRTAADYMRSKGGLVIVAAGNNNKDEGIAPTTSMIPVSATNSLDEKTSFSSWGSFVAMSAPGEGVWTTARGGIYQTWKGTSIASPVVAGVVALMMSRNPALKASQVESLLYSTAVDLGTVGRDAVFGYGRVNASAAVAAAGNATSLVDSAVPSVSITSPGANGTVSGLLPVSVTASDNVGVARVELRVNGVTVATDTVSPFGFSWDTKAVANGMAQMVAVAFDAAGNAGSSTAVSVNVANVAVQDTTPPAVTIANPRDGTAVAGGVIKISASASDNSGSAGITQSLYINGAKVASAVGGALNYSWNTRKLASGSYLIEVVASDVAGNSSRASSRVSR